MKRNSTDPEVLYEDNHLIVVNKKPSDIIQGDKTGDEPLSDRVKAYIGSKYNKPGEVFLGVAHRLDRPVSGAVIFARTSKALTRINEMLRNGEIHKTYWAVVKEMPPATTGHLVQYIVRNTQQNKSYVFNAPRPGAQRAELDYRLAASSDGYHLLEVNLLTGRHHQIRAQLSAMGCPIRGDLKYGAPRSNPDGSIHLHARRVEFIHPVRREQVLVIADPPSDPLWDYFVTACPEPGPQS